MRLTSIKETQSQNKGSPINRQKSYSQVDSENSKDHKDQVLQDPNNFKNPFLNIA